VKREYLGACAMRRELGEIGEAGKYYHWAVNTDGILRMRRGIFGRSKWIVG